MRKGHTHACPRSQGKSLQWGRNLTVAEGPAFHRAIVLHPPRTLQWGRNLTVAEGLWRATVCPPLDRHSIHTSGFVAHPLFFASNACPAYSPRYKCPASAQGAAPPHRAARGPPAPVSKSKVIRRWSPLRTGPLAGLPPARPPAPHTTNAGARPPPGCSLAPIVSMRPSEPCPYEGPTSTISTLSSA